jgi:RND family efflux transporter MFP subunit
MSEHERDEQRANLHRELEELRIDPGVGRTPKRRARRGWYWLILLLLVAGGVVAGRTLGNRTVAVKVAHATAVQPEGSILVPVLSGSGYVVTGERYVSIGVRVPGRIDRYYVEEGQTVRKDDPLVQLDDRDYRAALARTEAALAVARANEKLADRELARGHELHRRQVISRQELDVLVTKADVSAATVRQLEAELQQARVNLEYTILRAPTSGVVLAKLKEVGEIAVPGGFAGSGDLIRIANLSDLRAEVDVNEADLDRVRMSQPAEVTPDAYNDRHYPAEVVKLYPQVDRQKGTLKVEVRISRPDEKLLPDMSVRVTFLEPLTGERARGPIALIPAAAVRRGSDGASHVWIVNGGRVRRENVETAGNVGEQVRVVGSLRGGEAVVVSDDGNLAEGTAVREQKE